MMTTNFIAQSACAFLRISSRLVVVRTIFVRSVIMRSLNEAERNQVTQ